MLAGHLVATRFSRAVIFWAMFPDEEECRSSHGETDCDTFPTIAAELYHRISEGNPGKLTKRWLGHRLEGVIVVALVAGPKCVHIAHQPTRVQHLMSFC
jgi:hypothetical protein